MINLLPNEVRSGNSYGLKNRVLVSWVFAFIVSIAGIWAIIVFGHMQINQAIASEKLQISQSEKRLQDQDLDGTKNDIDSIDSSIKLALKVLEQKLLFSKLLQQIGAVMPEGTVLQGIGLQEIKGGISLIALAETYQAGTQIQINIADESNNVFKQADIINIACGEPENSANPQYPCTVNIQALFSDDNAFLFINQNDAVSAETQSKNNAIIEKSLEDDSVTLPPVIEPSTNGDQNE